MLSVLGGALGILGGAFCRPLTLVAREALFHWFPQQMANVPKLIQDDGTAPHHVVDSAGVRDLGARRRDLRRVPGARAASFDPIEALRHE